MSLAQALTVYISMNILIVCGCISLLVFSFFAKIIKTKFSSKAELNLHYFLLLAILTLTLVQPLMPQKDVFSPAAKVWSAQSIDQFNYEYQSLSSAGYLSMTTPIGASIFRAEQVSEIWTLAGVLLLFLGVFFIFRDLRKLLRLQKDSYSVRKIGQVQIFLSETVQVPFSYWLPGQANIVLPTNLVERPREYRIAIAHELQHHRNRDTKWVYVLWGLRLICVINPAIHFWNRWITEIQEFACDETLVDQRKVQSQAYARCLVEVAQSAINQKYVPVCATGLMFLIGRNLLKRRIEKMFDKSTKKMTKVRQFNISLAVGIFMSLAMGATALAAKGLIQDRRVSMAQAKVMATKAQRDTGIPIVINDLVLKQLNKYIGTPEGREYMQESLQRMENYRSLIEGKIGEYKIPSELLAVPIIESGYRNLEQSNNFAHGAGLWMFIVSTARIYGLRVDEQVDERLNVDILSDAAMRYFKSNYLRFRDWHLAALAYAIGESNVQRAIDKTGSRDAWVLVREGIESGQSYLPKLMAAIIIMRNPESIE